MRKPLTCFVYALVPGGLIWLGASALHQNELDYSLSEAVGNHNTAQIRHLLKVGANPNAPWSGYGWRDHLDRLLHHPYWNNDTIVGYAGSPNDTGEIACLLREYARKR